MSKLAIKWLLNAVAFILTARIVDSVLPMQFRVDDFGTALVAALVLGLINTFIRPLVKLFALPITFMTLGLFTLVINGLMLKLVGSVVAGVTIVGFLPALLGAVILSVMSGILTAFL